MVDPGQHMSHGHGTDHKVDMVTVTKTDGSSLISLEY